MGLKVIQMQCQVLKDVFPYLYHIRADQQLMHWYDSYKKLHIYI